MCLSSCTTIAFRPHEVASWGNVSFYGQDLVEGCFSFGWALESSRKRMMWLIDQGIVHRSWGVKACLDSSWKEMTRMMHWRSKPVADFKGLVLLQLSCLLFRHLGNLLDLLPVSTKNCTSRYWSYVTLSATSTIVIFSSVSTGTMTSSVSSGSILPRTLWIIWVDDNCWGWTRTPLNHHRGCLLL